MISLLLNIFYICRVNIFFNKNSIKIFELSKIETWTIDRQTKYFAT